MSAALVPSKFYGSSLPRPRFFSDPKLNDERVDPPSPVLEPFLTWAKQADWSKGGLSTEQTRLNGKIEGNLNNLRSEPESPSAPSITETLPPTPPAPIAIKKRKRILCLPADDDVSETESENCSEEFVRSEIGRFPIRKLADEFNLAANESVKKKSSARRTSPRLIKRRLN